MIDPVAAAKFLETLPAGDLRDRAVKTFSESTADVDPEAAAAWVVTIASADTRDYAGTNVYYRGRNSDPKAAADWLQTTKAISQEAKKRLLRDDN